MNTLVGLTQNYTGSDGVEPLSGAPKWRHSCRMCAPTSTYCIIGPPGPIMNKYIHRLYCSKMTFHFDGTVSTTGAALFDKNEKMLVLLLVTTERTNPF